MKGARATAVVVASLAVLCATLGLAWAGQDDAERGGVIFVSAEAAELHEVVPGVSKAILWGDHDEGPYGAFTRFQSGFEGGMHTHTNDVWLVVLEGAYLYRDEDGEKRVGAGSFLRIPGGKVHWSGGDAEEGALFYEESSGAFDFLPVE